MEAPHKATLSAGERTDRTVARTLADAQHVFDDRDDARQWMSAPHKELKTPIETARTEIGARCVEAVLNKLFFELSA